MRFHDDPRFVAVDAGHECTLNRRDETVLQLMSIFTLFWINLDFMSIFPFWSSSFLCELSHLSGKLLS